MSKPRGTFSSKNMAPAEHTGAIIMKNKVLIIRVVSRYMQVFRRQHTAHVRLRNLKLRIGSLTHTKL